MSSLLMQNFNAMVNADATDQTQWMDAYTDAKNDHCIKYVSCRFDKSEKY